MGAGQRHLRRGAGEPRLLPALGAQAPAVAGPQARRSRTPAAASTGRCRGPWRRRGTRRSSARRRCGGQRPRDRCCSSRRERSRSPDRRRRASAARQGRSGFPPARPWLSTPSFPDTPARRGCRSRGSAPPSRAGTRPSSFARSPARCPPPARTPGRVEPPLDRNLAARDLGPAGRRHADLVRARAARRSPSASIQVPNAAPRSVGAAQPVGHQPRPVVEVQREPVPAGLVGREVLARPFAVDPARCPVTGDLGARRSRARPRRAGTAASSSTTPGPPRTSG